VTAVTADRVIDFAPAPDGSSVAAVLQDGEGPGYLVIVNADSGEELRRMQSEAINLGSVAWSPDGQTLLVVRRDRLPDRGEGVPRLWLMRASGEFIAPLDPEGAPSLNGSFSPDGQSIAYVGPATGDLIVRNIASGEAYVVGSPRGGIPAWSPDSRLVAFESVPLDPGVSPPPQPVRVRGVDGEVDRTVGLQGETRSAPRFIDENTVVSVKRTTGADGTDLVFDFVDSGREVRRTFLTPGADQVLSWDLDPRATTVVYAVASAATRVAIRLDLSSGRREPLPLQSLAVRWIP
jgi:WD40 repeat protein